MRARLQKLLIGGIVFCLVATSILAWVDKSSEWLIYLGCFVPLGLGAAVFGVSAFANSSAPTGTGRHWWKNQPVPLRCGRLSSFGISMGLLSWATAAVTGWWLPEPYKAWVVVTCAVLFFASLAMAYVGWRLDQIRQGLGPDGLPLQSPHDELARIPLPCQCGQEWPVTEGAAGTTFPCTCGQTISVPSLRQLRRRLNSREVGPA